MSSDEAFIKLGNSVNPLVEQVGQLKTLAGDKSRFNSTYFSKKTSEIEHALNECKHLGLTYIESKELL